MRHLGRTYKVPFRIHNRCQKAAGTAGSEKMAVSYVCGYSETGSTDRLGKARSHKTVQDTVHGKVGRQDLQKCGSADTFAGFQNGQCSRKQQNHGKKERKSHGKEIFFSKRRYFSDRVCVFTENIIQTGRCKACGKEIKTVDQYQKKTCCHPKCGSHFRLSALLQRLSAAKNVRAEKADNYKHDCLWPETYSRNIRTGRRRQNSKKPGCVSGGARNTEAGAGQDFCYGIDLQNDCCGYMRQKTGEQYIRPEKSIIGNIKKAAAPPRCI